MIVGNGLIANKFKKEFAKTDNILLFASGVSNSLCNDKNEFEREKNKLLNNLNVFSKINSFIYFSTISIDDPSLNESLYVKHKLEMESLVLKHSRAKVFRLGQLASRSLGNNNNLLNFLNNSIKARKKIALWDNAFRSILDIDDVVSIVTKILAKPSINNNIINVSNPIFNSIREIVEVFEKINNMKLDYVCLKKGEEFYINLKIMNSINKDCGILFNKSYLEKVIKKYYL
tara:strand:+ start:378 stop:1070 length:693 start_codon:yes stop_codon:yes gene_type:complete